LRWLAAAALAFGGCLPFPDDARYRCTDNADCLASERCGPKLECIPRALDAEPLPEPDAGPRPDAHAADAAPRDAGFATCGFDEHFDDTFDPNAWQLNGSAIHGPSSADGFVRLTPLAARRATGTVMHRQRMRADTFTLQMVFEVGTDDSGPADGMAMGWFDEESSAAGLFGRSLGYIGLLGYAVAIDTFQNPGEPSPNHVALVRTLGGAAEDFEVIGETTDVPAFNRTGPHAVTLEFDMGSAKVFVDGAMVLTATVADYQPFDATFGFTGANGDNVGNQDVLDVQMQCAVPRGYPGALRFRRPITIAGTSSVAGVTARIPIPHAAIVAEGKSRADGRDLAIYRGPSRLDTQWDDAAKIGTDDLMLVVRLPPRSPGLLYLYYGDPLGSEQRTDRVFELAERFDAPLRSWTNGWDMLACADRVSPLIAIGSACTTDATPTDTVTLRALVAPGFLRASDTTYEVSAHFGGGMAEPSDVVYLAESNSGSVIPAASYVENHPDTALTYTEAGMVRTSTGWHRPIGASWTRTRLRFIPRSARPRLVFRYVSPPPADVGQTQVLLDDVTVRRVSEPELAVTLGAEQHR